MPESMPQHSEVRTQHLQLVQVLDQARRHARTQPGDRWQEIADRCDDLLGAYGMDGDDPAGAQPVVVARIDRGAIELDDDTADQLASALMALEDDPSEERLDAAARRLAAARR